MKNVKVTICWGVGLWSHIPQLRFQKNYSGCQVENNLKRGSKDGKQGWQLINETPIINHLDR